MDLTTRCPKCGTVFQAGLSDLQLRKGYIRCVQCAHIFDGYAEVVSDASAPEAPAPRPAAAPVAEPPAAPPPQVIRSGRPPAPPSLPFRPQRTHSPNRRRPSSRSPSAARPRSITCR